MRTLCGTFVILVYFTAWAQAQNSGVVVEFEDGTRVTPTEVNNRVSASTKKSVIDCPAWVVSDGWKPLRRPLGEAGSGATTPSGASALAFMEKVSVVYTTQLKGASEGQSHLICQGEWGTPNVKILGWVPETRIITRPTSMTNPGDGVKIKGLVINSRKYLKEKKSFDIAKSRLSPDDAARETATFRFFNFYFVWKDTMPDHDDSGYVLLGEQPSFNSNNAETSSREEIIRLTGMQGWVHKSRICLWKTREAFQWNDREPNREPVWAFLDVDRALRDERVPALDAVEEFENDRPKLWEHDRMRYPRVAFPNPRSEQKELVQDITVAGNKLYKIGLVGDVINENNQIVTSQQKMAELQDKLARIKAQLQKIEILFVVDDTTSMRRWFAAAADAIDRIATRAEQADREVRAAITFYHDISMSDRADRANLVGAVETMRLAAPRSPAFRDKLKQIRTKTEENGYDKREQMFLGLEMGLDDFTQIGAKRIHGAGFSTAGPRKLVILIGDDGNHELGTDEERQVIDRIVNKLAPRDSKQTPIEFVALHVAPADDEHTRAFKRQATEIGTKLNDRLRQIDPDQKDRRRYFPVGSETELLAEIDHRYDELVRRAQDLTNTIDLYRRGDLKVEEDSTLGSPKSRGGRTRFNDPELGQLLAAEGVKFSELEHAAEGMQVFDYHYVFENARRRGSKDLVPQLRKQVLLNGGDLKIVTSHLKEFFQGEEGDIPTEQQLAESIVKLQTGDNVVANAATTNLCVSNVVYGGDDSISGQLQMRHGISFDGPLTRYTLEQLRQKSSGGKHDVTLYQLKMGLRKKLSLLEDIQNDIRYRYKDAFADDRVLLKRDEVIDRKGQNSRKFLRGDNRFIWVWIDHQEEWP